jgi:hypothetical protein
VLFVILGFAAISSKPLAFILALYQFLNLVLQTAPVRTFVLNRGRSTSTFFLSCFLAQFGSTALVVMSLSVPGPKVEKRLSEGDGFFNHLFIIWALPLMWQGRKGNFDIDYELHPEMGSTELYRRFQIAWDREM